MGVVKSVYDNQLEILNSVVSLHCNGKIDADFSYGNGGFYKEIEKPKFCFDLDDEICLKHNVTNRSSVDTNLGDSSVESIMFDPPFLTYVRAARHGNSSMVMSNRFGGYWTYDELTEHYVGTLKEASRVLVNKGLLIFKCQDIIHNHKMHPTHINVVNWGSEFGFRLKDLFVLTAKHRMPSPNRGGTQKHARVFHSYFLVLEVKK